MTLAKITEWLTNTRKSQGLSQRDVARLMQATSLSGASVCQWETGAKRPRADHLIAWADALGYAVTLIPKATTAEGSAEGGTSKGSEAVAKPYGCPGCGARYRTAEHAAGCADDHVPTEGGAHP